MQFIAKPIFLEQNILQSINVLDPKPRNLIFIRFSFRNMMKVLYFYTIFSFNSHKTLKHKSKFNVLI
jgi:hypothetical protein